MTLKLNGSSSGYTAINAPASAGSNTLVLPADNGSANEVLKTDGSGNLDWVAQGSGLFSAYAFLTHQESEGGNGGSSVQDAWTIRTLNTEIFDSGNIVTLPGSNVFSITNSGTYFIEWTAPAFESQSHKTRLYDVTGSAVVGYGSSQRIQTSDNGQSNSSGAARVTIGSTNQYRIEHWASTAKSSTGFGHNVGGSMVETYLQVKIYKEA